VAITGLLLTGGASRRMGQDKSALFSASLAARLAAVTDAAFEVGPGRTSLPCIADPGHGPLAALAAAAPSAPTAALVLACDMPFVTEDLLRWLAGCEGTAVPIVDQRIQPLCARYSAADVQRSIEVVEAGGRAMRALLDGADVTWLDSTDWPALQFADMDTPDDLVKYGL
jgi:molybdopterin-guanine dinucleotide biosynthesis protein A